MRCFLRVGVTLASAAIFLLSTTGVAGAAHFRPKAASPKRDALVIAYRQCQNPNASHGPSWFLPSCNPPVPISQFLEVGEPGINGFPANFIGSSKLTVCIPPTCAASDVEIDFSVTDVRCTALLAGTFPAVCPSGAHLEYTGKVLADYPLRITDRCNGGGVPPPAACPPAPGLSATMQDTHLPVVVPCAPAGPGVGSTCAVATSFNAVMPGAIQTSQRMNIATHVAVYDGGEDGNHPNPSPSNLFAEEGVFVP
jgi:hypothetical protein